MAVKDRSEEKDQRVVVPLGHPLVGVTTAEAMVLNPVYLQLNQDLIATRMRLATNRRSVELLQEQLLDRLIGMTAAVNLAYDLTAAVEFLQLS